MLHLIGCAALASSLALAAGDTWSNVKSTVQNQLAKLSDAQVLGALTAANDAELDAARLAQNQATDPQVKGFAQHMVADHTASNQQVAGLAKRLNVSPQTSSTSEQFTETAKAEKSVLQSLSGAAFDQAYVDRQVADHQTVLDQLDHALIPSASSEDLKTLLTRTRDVVDEHLQAAKKIQAQLQGRR